MFYDLINNREFRIFDTVSNKIVARFAGICELGKDHLCQFSTGAKDKNGLLIFEGDNVSLEEHDNLYDMTIGVYIGEVFFQDGWKVECDMGGHFEHHPLNSNWEIIKKNND